ncbi:MAG: hypothetical protein SGJ27_30335 [Candidatus Melainabacteria bacterium]|nr:hypothetical protein [Candidatus Melainabacteria bacterium]
MTSSTKPKPAISVRVKSIFKNVTPVRLRLYLVGNCLFAIAIAMLAILTVEQHKHALQTVGHDAAPSVVAAHNIKLGVSRMSGTLADEFLSGDPETVRQSEIDFESGRTTVCHNLVEAAKNITYGPAEQTPIEQMQLDFSKFGMQAQHARDLSASQSLEEAWTAYNKAFVTVEKSLTPHAESLCSTNLEILEATYADEKSKSAMLCGAVLGFGIALALTLGAAQVYLFKHFRRRFSIPLVIATLTTVLFVNHVYADVHQSAERLRFAKEDSYDSIFAVVSSHSALYSAKAAESRYLLDRDNSLQYEQAFAKDIDSITKFEPGHNFDYAIAEAHEKLKKDTESLTITGLSGGVADEFGSIEYAGEGEAAMEILMTMKDYVEADRKMRKLEKSGAHDEAVKMCLSYAPGGLKYYFERVDDAMVRALRINRGHFDEQVSDAFKDLAGLVILSEFYALLTVSCIYLGLRSRLAEYSK